MKITHFLLLASAAIFSRSAIAQCTNTSAYTSQTAPAPGGSVQVSSCSYAGEYNQINSVTAGHHFISYTSIGTDYITIRSGTYNGALVASGQSPLSWTAPSSGTYFEHINTNSSCGTVSSCRDTYLKNLLACTNTSLYTSVTAPSPGFSVQVSSCSYAGEHNVLNSITAGNVYVSNTTVGTDFITITRGTATGPVVASGTSPLTWTASISGTYYEHINTNSSCGTAAVCRNTGLSNITIPPPANDNCSGAVNIVAGNTATGTTVNSSLETPAPPTCSTTLNQPGVWYTVTGNGNKLGADLCAASSWDSKIFVYTGACGAFTCVTGNDDNGPMCSNAAASVTWCSVPGTVYRILVTGYSTPSNFTIAITQSVVPAISVSGGSLCSGSSFTLVPSGAATYTYSGGTSVVSPTVNTTYTVVGTGTAGCISQTPGVATVSVQSSPTITVNSGSICAGTVFTINPSGALSYTISGGSAAVSPAVTTNYSVTGTGTNGCVSAPPAISSVVVNALPVITAPGGSICAGSSFTLTPSGAATYTFSSGTAVVTPTATSSYSVTGTSTAGCTSASITVVTVTVGSLPVITVNSGTICAGSSFTMNPSGAASYSFTGGSAVVTPSATSSYSVTGSSSLGCLSASPAISTVSVSPLPTITVNSGSVCAGSVFVIVPSGASSYSYSSGSATVAPSANSSYTVTGTSAEGCASASAAISSVTVIPGPTVNLSATATLVCAGEAVTLIAGGATTYDWGVTGNTTASLVITPAATAAYSVTGIDGNGCTGTASYTMNVTPCTGLSAGGQQPTGIRIFPNPGNGVFTVETDLPGTINLEITDLTGRIVLETELQGSKLINISQLANGIYSVRLAGEASSATRIIKQ